MTHPCPVRNCRTDGELTMVESALCLRHERRSLVSLLELPRYYVDLALAMVPGTTTATDKVSGSTTPPLPINATARALQEDACRLVRNAENDYRRSRAWRPLRRAGREGQRLASGVVFLSRHWEPILTTDWGVDVALDVLRIVGGVRTVLRLDRLVHKLPAPCPNCDSMALEREDGGDRVRCRNCGIEYTEDDYRRLVLILASQA